MRVDETQAKFHIYIEEKYKEELITADDFLDFINMILCRKQPHLALIAHYLRKPAHRWALFGKLEQFAAFNFRYYSLILDSICSLNDLCSFYANFLIVPSLL